MEFSSKKESLSFKKIKKLTEKALRKPRYIRKANLYHPLFLLQGSLILSGNSKLRESKQIYALHAFDYDDTCYVRKVDQRCFLFCLSFTTASRTFGIFISRKTFLIYLLTKWSLSGSEEVY